MAKGTKRNKKQKKGSRSSVNFDTMPPAQVADKGDQLLAAGNAREAIKAFKGLKKKGYEPEELFPRLFQAYLVRYEQLMKKNMVKEADLVMESAIEFFPTGKNISLDTLEIGIRLLPLEKATTLYRGTLSCRESFPQVERLLANRAVLEDCLHVLDLLPPDLTLVCEKECLERAIPSMNEGHWDEALKTLMPISRKSAFADIKIFAKLMDSFVNKDKPGIKKAASMLGDNFPLTSLPMLLNQYATQDALPMNPDAVETASRLWGQSFLNDDHAKNFKQGVSQNNPVKIKKAVEGLTAGLALPEKQSAVQLLSEIAGQGVMNVTQELDQVLNLYEKFSLPNPDHFFARFAAPKGNFLSDYTEILWKDLSLIFPDKAESNLAKALILVQIAEKMINDSIMGFDLKDKLNTLFINIGFGGKIYIKSLDSREDMHLVALALVEQALVFDPENKKACELMLNLSIDSPALRKALTPLLEIMAKVFPDDPRPCLRLAQIYTSKNAVRKAETSLKEAFSRAPHNGDVLEQYALSHVLTANKNIKRKKFALALRDLDVAKKMEVASLGVHVAEKRLLCELVQTSEFSKKMFEDLTQDLSLAQTLRMLALFKMEIQDPELKAFNSPLGFDSIFNNHKKRINELTSREIVSILKPVVPPHGVLYHESNCFSCFMDKQGTIFAGMTSRDFLNIVPDIAQVIVTGETDPPAKVELMEIIVNQLSKRIDTEQDGDDLIFLKFIHLCLTHIWGDEVKSQDFLSIIDSASASMKEKLRTISRRMAPIAPESYRFAYEKFDFNLLDVPSLLENFPFAPGSNIMDEFAKIIDKATGGNMNDFMGALMDLDDDNIDVEDVNLKDFQAKKIFGSKININIVYDLVYDFVEDALWVCHSSRIRSEMDMDVFSMTFMKSFDCLMGYLKKKGYHSSEDFKQAGKKFCENVLQCREIIRAFNLAKKHGKFKISKDIKDFILGMKQGI